jgi:hypothetical protein
MLTIMCYKAMGQLAKRIFLVIGFLNEWNWSNSILICFWALIANDRIKLRD